MSIRVVGIDEQSNQLSGGHGLLKEFQSLCDDLVYEIAHASCIACRSIETCDQAGFDRVLADDEDNGRRRACRLCSHRRGQCNRGNQGNPAACEIRGQSRETIELALGPPIFDVQISSHDIAGFGKALTKAINGLRPRIVLPTAEKANRRDRLLLPVRAKRPGNSSASDESNNIAPPCG